MKFSSTTLAITTLIATSTTVQASSGFELQFPNGAVFGIDLGHIDGDSGLINDFGMAQAAGWAAICDLDSDGDGIKNKDELGDPDCVWTADGGVDPAITDPALLSNPGDANSVPAAGATTGATTEPAVLTVTTTSINPTATPTTAPTTATTPATTPSLRCEPVY